MKFKKYSRAQVREIAKMVHDILHEVYDKNPGFQFAEFYEIVFNKIGNDDPLYMFHVGMAVEFVFLSHKEGDVEIRLIDLPIFKEKKRKVN